MFCRLRIYSGIQQLLEREVFITFQSGVIVCLILLHSAISFGRLPSLVCNFRVMDLRFLRVLWLNIPSLLQTFWVSLLVILISLFLQKCNAINPQLSSFGSEVELNEVSDTIQQLLRWGWKYNKNLEEQAAQLHMLTGWSQIVEVSVFIFLLIYFYVHFGILNLHFAMILIVLLLAEGLRIQKNIIS